MIESKRNNLGKINKKKKANHNGIAMNQTEGSQRSKTTLSRSAKEMKNG